MRPAADHAQNGLSTVVPPHEPSAAGERDVAEILEDFLRRSGVPGVAAGLFTSEGVVAQAARGVSSIECPELPMTPQTVGTALSLSKVMTATALGVLAARGQVDFDAPVSNHLPDVYGRDRFDTTTLRHLLSHTAGLVHGPVPYSAKAKSADPLEHYVLGACLGAARFAEPGQVFGYSNVGITIAGYVLQKVTGKPFATAMRETLFAPAGMSRTTVDPLVAMTYPLSQQHVLDGAGELVVRRSFDAAPTSRPSTGAFSCARDLARLGVVHLGGTAGDGDRPLLTADVVRDLHTPVVDVGLDILRSFGLTLTVGPRYGRFMSVGHEGYYEGGWIKLLLIPEQRIGVAWMDNRGEDPALEDDRQRCYDRLLALLGGGARSWRRDEEICDLDVSSAAGRYVRPAGRPMDLTAGPYGLRATDGVTTADYDHLTGRVFVARGDATDLPARIPWAPDKDSTRSAMCVVGPAQAPTHILMNGLPYQRR